MADEVEQELEALMSVYGVDCTVLQRSPPFLLVSLKPRTAYDISQQFVEAVLVIKASVQYPNEPPQLDLKDTKGLDEERLSVLLSSLRALTSELAFYPMLVAICEAATDMLTNMNQPEGNCSFCMLPLVIEDKEFDIQPIIKLLSCFHCFHSKCFGRWWRWLLSEQNLELPYAQLGPAFEQDNGSMEAFVSHKHMLELLVKEIQLKCPVCRKAVTAEDMAPVWSFLTTDSNKWDEEQNMILEPELIFTEEEIARKSKFDCYLKAQQLCGGIIEPKKLEVIVSGMFVTPTPRLSGLGEEAGIASSSKISNTTSSSVSEQRVAQLPSQEDNTAVGQHSRRAKEGPDVACSSGVPRTSKGKFNSQIQKEGRQPKLAGVKQKGQWIIRKENVQLKRNLNDS